MAIAYQHVREAPRPPSEARPGLPKELDAIVLKALNKNPLNRYQTAAEMRSDLVRALSGQAVQATPLMSRRRAHRADARGAHPASARRRIAAAAGSAGAVGARDGDWEPDGRRPVRSGCGASSASACCCVALLVGAIWLTLG